MKRLYDMTADSSFNEQRKIDTIAPKFSVEKVVGIFASALLITIAAAKYAHYVENNGLGIERKAKWGTVEMLRKKCKIEFQYLTNSSVHSE